MRIGLKTAILAAGKSQRKVASESGMSENRLSEIVCGWTDPRDPEREALMRVLGCPPIVFEKNVVLEARDRR